MGVPELKGLPCLPVREPSWQREVYALLVLVLVLVLVLLVVARYQTKTSAR